MRHFLKLHLFTNRRIVVLCDCQRAKQQRKDEGHGDGERDHTQHAYAHASYAYGSRYVGDDA